MLLSSVLSKSWNCELWSACRFRPLLLLLLLAWTRVLNCNGFLNQPQARQVSSRVQNEKLSTMMQNDDSDGATNNKTKTTDFLQLVPNHHDNNNGNNNDNLGLYVHIPYCRRRCRYCNFAILPIGSKVQTEKMNINSNGHDDSPSNNENDTISINQMTRGFLEMDKDYRTTILQEINLLRHQLQQRERKFPIVLKSIYFGGGTPSLAPLETIQGILNALLVKNTNTNNNDNNNNNDSNNNDNDNNSPLFALAPNAEVSIEMDPGTFSLHKLQSLKAQGFNRISLGVQSFDDTMLESIGRVHRKKDVLEAVQMIQTVFGGKSGSSTESSTDDNKDDVVNYSMDLISGLPGLSLAMWAETLATAVSLKPRPNHLSIYDLQVEQGTVFGKWYDPNNNNKSNDNDNEDNDQFSPSQGTRGPSPVQVSQQQQQQQLVASRSSTAHDNKLRLPSEEDCAFMYKYAAGYLKAKGYEHYEVSSYAFVGNNKDEISDTSRDFRQRNRSQHNQIYWDINGQWIALGLGATSFINGKMTARPRTLVDYRKWVEGQAKIQQKDIVRHRLSGDDEGIIDKMDFLTDVIMKRLRTSDGLDLDWIEQNYGQACFDAVMKGAKLGLELGLMTVTMEAVGNGSITLHSHGSLRLTDPDGFLYSNNLISSIFVELDAYQEDPR